jgi:hypothetical protein
VVSESLRVIGVAAVLAAAVLATAIVVAARERESTAAAYAARLHDVEAGAAALEAENRHLAGQMRGLLGEVAALGARIEESYAPVEVGGRLDLPIHRAFARPGDDLVRFSRREGVAVAVLRALNPWLPEGAAPLKDRQSLWIPKPPDRDR